MDVRRFHALPSPAMERVAAWGEAAVPMWSDSIVCEAVAEGVVRVSYYPGTKVMVRAGCGRWCLWVRRRVPVSSPPPWVLPDWDG